MNQLKYFTIILISTSLLACAGKVAFNEPQPTDTKNVAKFPKHLQGQFLNVKDSSVLLISDNLIQRIFDFDNKIHLNELDSNTRLSGDMIIDLNTEKQTPIKRDGDSLIVHVHYVDTLIHMDYDNVVRKYKGYYFLNNRYGETSWVVQKMQLVKGLLIISSISNKTEITNLTKITESPQDTIPPYKYTATKKQFKKFIKDNGFDIDEVYIKQKKKTTP